MTQKTLILNRKTIYIDIRSCKEQEYLKKRRKVSKGKKYLAIHFIGIIDLKPCT